MEKVHKIKVPWPPRGNCLSNPDICAGSLRSAMLSTCHDGKNALLLVTKSDVRGTTKKFSVLGSYVVIHAFVACRKLYA